MRLHCSDSRHQSVHTTRDQVKSTLSSSLAFKSIQRSVLKCTTSYPRVQLTNNQNGPTVSAAVTRGFRLQQGSSEPFGLVPFCCLRWMQTQGWKQPQKGSALQPHQSQNKTHGERKQQGNRNQRQNKTPQNRSPATWLRTKNPTHVRTARSCCVDELPLFFLAFSVQSHLRPSSRSSVRCRILEHLGCFCHNQHAVSAFPILLYYCNESKSRNTIISELIYYRRSDDKQSMPAVDACSFLLLLEASPS